MKRIAIGVAAATLLIFAGPAHAAAPDGPGPWADAVADFQQGRNNVGAQIASDRSNPASALGVAENLTVPTTFVSLGFGGRIDLQFENRICNGAGGDLDLQLVEATNEPYADELVDVYVSRDGITYVPAASAVDKDATVGLPASVPVAHYVRLVDVTLKSQSRDNADGYDVDGVRALHGTCTENRPPDCANVSAGPTLWPPNHKFRVVTLTGVTDPDGDAVTITPTGVTQDEVLNGVADGNTTPDAKIVAGVVSVRAERSGVGDGRVYRIAFIGRDAKGATCTGTATVGVPHDQGNGSVPVDSGLVVNSLG